MLRQIEWYYSIYWICLFHIRWQNIRNVMCMNSAMVSCTGKFAISVLPTSLHATAYKALANKIAILEFEIQTPQHLTYLGWTFGTEFFSALYHPQDTPHEKKSVAIVHPKYIKCWGVWIANSKIAILFANASYVDLMIIFPKEPLLALTIQIPVIGNGIFGGWIWKIIPFNANTLHISFNVEKQVLYAGNFMKLIFQTMTVILHAYDKVSGSDLPMMF